MSGIKTWDDADDQDGKRPANVTVRLHADGIEKDTKTVSPDASGNWSYSFENLPKYKDGGIEIKYTVTEDATEGYQPSYTPTSSGFNITNSYAPGKTSVSVSKHWEDNDNQDGKRTDATVRLFADGVDTGKTLTLTEEKRTDVFSDLDEYKDGKKIQYTVAELDGDKGLKEGERISNGYTVSYAGDAKAGFTIANTYTPETVAISGTKIWNDNNDQDGKRPDKVTVRLHADGEVVDTQTVTEDETGNWTYSFTDLPKYENGKEIVYNVTEDVEENYTSNIDGYNIVNNYTPSKTEVEVSKAWRDSSDQDGIRPDSVTVKLLADGATTDKTVTLNKENNWTAAFEALDEYKSGRKIAYTVEEVRTDVITGTDGAGTYVTSTSGDATTGYVITNTHTPVKTQVNVIKKWEDADDQDGKRPASVTVKLLADGEDTGKSLVLNEANEWKASFTDPDVNKAGKVIDYTVAELDADAELKEGETGSSGYTVSYTGDAVSGYTITNTYTPETVRVAGSKTWDDADDQDGKRPANVTVRLHADGIEKDTKTVSPDASGNWSYSFENLPKYKDGGIEIKYTVTEDATEGYQPNYIPTSSGFNITNSYAPGKTSVSVSKHWEDKDDQDGKRTDVTVRLFADGVDTGKTLTLTEEKRTDVFSDLDEYKDGKKIQYTVAELDGDKELKEGEQISNGYTVSYAGDAKAGFTIANTYTPETVSVSGTKIWNDNNDQDGKRPDKITVRLHADGEVVDTQTVTEDETGNWTYSFTDLPKYKNGNEIVYTVTEDVEENYTSVIDGYNIVNNYTPGTTEVEVNKAWHDSSDQDGIRPDSVTVKLLADGATTDKTVTLNKENNWTAEFEALDEYKSGRKIEYTVEEVRTDVITGTDGAGTYATSTSGDATTGYVITNTHTPVKTQVNVIKKWEDADNQDGKRPASVTVKLLADGEGTDKSLVLNEANEWKASFTDLDANKAGKVIDYTVAELDADAELKEGETGSSGYTVSYTGDAGSGYTITNTYTPETVRVAGIKTWDDADNQDGKRPANVTVRLLADGIEKDTKTVSPDASGNWSYSFENLPKYKDGGIEIKYTVTEDATEGYQPRYTPTSSGFNITNSYAPGKTSVSVSKHWEDNDNQDGKRTDATVRLLADGVDTGKTLTLTEDKMTDVFADLDEYKDGKKIVYTVAELDGDKELKDGERISNGYTVSCSGDAETGYTITNTYTPETVAISGTKTWNDNDNQDGKRPDKVTVRLHADGEVVDTQPVEADENGEWKYSFTNLAKYKNGKEIDYTVTEDLTGDYQAHYNTTANGTDITNEYTPGKTEVSVSKHWEDNEDQDGIRPEEVKVRLLADGATTDKTVTLNKENNWTAEFEALDEYKSGRRIEYTVEEVRTDVITGTDGAGTYVTSTSGDATTGYVITNTHTPVKTQVNVIKKWEDADNQDGKRPASVTVKLLADGEGTGKSLVLNEENEWKASFTDLDANKAGKEIDYTVAELDADAELKEGEAGSSGYTVSYTGDVGSGYTITNTYTPETVRVAGIKTWEDADNQDGKRPANVTVRLHADGIEQDMKTVSPDASGNWSYSFENLPKYKDGGIEIKYTVTEDATEGYQPVYTPTSSGFNITNSYAPGKTSVSVSKHWEDNDDQDGKRTGATIRLLADGVDTGKTLTLTEEKRTDVFSDLDEYKDGKKIVYTVAELDGDKELKDGERISNGYTVSCSGDAETGYTITNTYTPETVAISGTKTWNDNNDQDGKRPDKITVRLHADGEVFDTQPVEADENGEWKYSFTELAKYKNGKEIVYTVTEDSTEDYQAHYNTTANGTDITNKYTPGKTEVSVSKHWEDNEDQDGIRPEEVQVRLLADGATTDKTVTLNKENNWTAAFEALDEYKSGRKIEYTAEEVRTDVITGTDGADTYATSTSGDATTGYVITNTHTPVKTQVDVTKRWEDADNQDGKRPASVTVKLLADGEGTGKSLVLNEANEWKASFTDLDVNKAGKVIDYTVAELDADAELKEGETGNSGYTVSYTGDAGSGYTITNTYTPETVRVAGIKTWDDANNQDGKRPESITINLLEDGTKVDSKVVTEADEWKWTFDKLAKYKEGKEIKYTITEEPVAEYTPTIDGYNVTNKHTPETISFSGTKHWDDNNNQDGKRPASVTVRLHADGVEKFEIIVKPDENGAWSYSFGGLPKYEAGRQIEYSVTEDEPEGYRASYRKNGDSHDITNTHAPETTQLTLTKTWNDAAFTTGDAVKPGTANEYARPDLTFTITGTVKGTQEKVSETTEKLTAADQKAGQSDVWEKTIDNLPKYNSGREIEYTASENVPDGFEGGNTGGSFTNTPKDKKTTDPLKLTILKTDKISGSALEGAVFTVKKTGESAGKALAATGTDGKITHTFTEAGTYTIEETTAPTGYKQSSAPYTIVVDEELKSIRLEENVWNRIFKLVKGDGSAAEITGDEDSGYTLTVANEPETVDIEVDKKWYDDGMFDASGNPIGEYKRPDKITVNLTDENGNVAERAELTEAGDWKHKWTVPKYNKGELINYPDYTVAEVNVPEGFGGESGHPEPVEGESSGADGQTGGSDSEGGDSSSVAGYKAVILNAPYFREEYKPVSLNIYKIDADTWGRADDFAGNAEGATKLAGAEFTVTEVSDAQTDSVVSTTDAQGKAEITFYKPGSFFIEEQKAPTGYIKADGSFRLTTEADAESLSITYDEQNGEWVKTYALKLSLAGASGSMTPAPYIDADTNSIAIGNTQETTEITVTKIWNDKELMEGEAAALGEANEYRRPETLHFSIVGKANGQTVYSGQFTMSAADADMQDSYRWKKTISDLKKYSGGTEIVYSVEEQHGDSGGSWSFDEENASRWGYGRAVKSGDGLTFTNTPLINPSYIFYNSLAIKKVDADTDRPLAGAVFTITDPDGNTTDIPATNTDGFTGPMIAFKAGTYKIKEKTAPAGYEADTTEYTLVIDEKLSAVRYVQGMNYTGTQGFYVKNYTYSIADGSSPEFTKNGSAFELTVVNTSEKVDVAVTKEWDDADMFDAQGNPIGSYKRPDKVTAVLTDKPPDSATNQVNEVGRVELTVDENGVLTGVIKDLPKTVSGKEVNYEDYFLIESPVPDGFTCEPSRPVKGADGNYTAKISNTPKIREEYTPVEVKLFKYSEAKTIPATEGEEPRDVPLPGVEFTVTEENADAAAGAAGSAESGEAKTLTTDEYGKTAFTADAPGQKFVIKESKTLDGYYNNNATFTLGVEKGELERLTFDADAGEWVKTYGLDTEALMEGKSPADLKIETPPRSDPDGTYLEENEDTYILRNTPLATLVVEKYFIDAGMRTYEDAPKEFAITLSYTDAAGNAQEKKLTVDPDGEYWYSGGNASLCRWLVPGIPYNAEVTLKERGLGKQGYALINTEAFVWRMDPNGPRYESDMTGNAQVSADNTIVTFNMPAHFDPDPAWKYSEEDGGGSLGLLGARVRFQNHYSAEIDITGTKLWRDGGRTHDNASEVTLTLYRRASGSVADAEKVAGATPTWDGNKYTFANQPISERSGNRYVYWVIEDRVEGYDAPEHTYDGAATSVPGAPNGGLILNELTQDYVEITVTKQWDDASDQDGKRPDDLALALYRTGKEGDETYTQKVNGVTPEVSKSGNDWTYTFKNQLKYDSQRYEFIYEVREETVPDGYTRTYCDVYGHPLLSSATGARNRGIIKNTHTPETTTISGTKTWNDGDNRDGKRPASITVNLLADDTKVDSATVTPDASGAWTFSFADKPVYKNGAEIVYTVEEEAVEGYTAEVRGFNITNTHAPERVSISGTKEWKHAEGGDADPTVDSFTVKLQKSTDGTTWTDVASKTVAARTTDPSVAPNAWTFENQYKYEGGVELKYRCIESPAVAGWVATEGTEGNGYKITNTTSQEQISFSVKKVWEDNNNAAGKRPASVKVGLYRYDSSVAGGYAFVKEIELSAASNWQTTVTANKYHNGVEARYSVRELSALADGYYQRMVSGSAVEGFEVENYRPERTISGQKVWSVPTGVDAGLFPKPESITVYLQKKVGDAWETVETKTVPTSGTGADTWTFSNVAQIDSQTKENIEYRVAEEPVPGWTVSLEGTAANNYNIVNVLDNPTTVRLVKTWDDNNNAGGLRPGTEAFANGGYLKLLRDGVDTGIKPLVHNLSGPNAYTAIWTVPASDTATYTVEESPVPGYVAGEITGSGTQTDPYKLTNTISTTISGTKTWPDDETVKMGWTVPDSITVKLQKKDGDAWTDVESKTVSKDASTGKWTYTFEGLPKYDTGTEIEYRVVEESVAGYKASGGTAADNYNLINGYDERTITLTKTWAGDGTAPSGTRPDLFMFPLYLQLYRNDELWNTDAPTPDVVDNGDNTYTVTYVVPRADENGNEYEYRIEETDIQNYAEGTITGSMEAGYAVTNTYEAPEPSAVDISVSMNYENGYPAQDWGAGLGWGGIVKGVQTVTFTNTSTNETKTLIFTPVVGGGTTATQTVQLEAGTYTLKQTAYTPDDLDAAADTIGSFWQLYLMRTIDQTITVDSSGNCTLSTSGNDPGNSFHAQYFWQSVAVNPKTGDYDVPVFEPDSDYDETGHTAGYNSSCTVSGSSITLKSIISNGDPGLSES